MFNIEYVGCDFDSTLSMLEKQFPKCGNPSEGFQVMKDFQAAGGKVILWTCRTGKALDMAIEFCKSQGFIPVAVNKHTQEQIDNAESMDIEISPRKIYCHMYIDDKSPEALLYGINWKLIRHMLFDMNQFIQEKLAA